MRWMAVFMGVFGLMSIHGQTLSWSADTNRLKIGERAEISIRLSDGEGFELEQFKDTIGPLEILSQAKLDTVSSNPWVVEQRYIVTGFDTGYIAIQPAIAIFAKDTLRSEGLFFEIRNPEEVPEEIEPIHPPEKAPKTLLEWLMDILLYVLLPLGLIFGLIYGWKRLKNKTTPGDKENVLPQISAEEWLEQQFAERRRNEFFNHSDSKHYYDEMTDIIRQYIYRTTEIHAMEMVTSELMTALRARNLFESDLELLRELLQLADMAKFAKGTQSIEVHRRDFDRMEAMVMKWIQSERDESN